jgi:hypothetical protein
MEGVVYKEYSDADHNDGGHTIDPFTIPARWPRWRLIDYGGSAPTACVWVAIGDNETAYVYREHYERDLSIQENARRIMVASGAAVTRTSHPPRTADEGSWVELKGQGGEPYRANYIDPHAFDVSPANRVTIADQYRRCGIACLPWPHTTIMGEHALVQRVKFRLENRLLKVFKNCVNTRREFRSWKYKCDKEGRPLAADAFENGNNHILDCLKGFFGTGPCFAGGGIRMMKNGR